jgi:Fur family transcriptional regulator, peroxide stress response regulator
LARLDNRRWNLFSTTFLKGGALCNIFAISKLLHLRRRRASLGMRKVRLEKAAKLDLLESLCRQRGVPVTVQRRVIFGALVERADHPTIDQIFADVRQRLPGISRTTVYRTLETLVELGIAKRTNHFETAARFDGNTGHHHHLVCLRCNKVLDFDDPGLSRLSLPDMHRTGFEVTDFSVYFEGLCPNCRQPASKTQQLEKPVKNHHPNK